MNNIMLKQSQLVRCL